MEHHVEIVCVTATKMQTYATTMITKNFTKALDIENEWRLGLIPHEGKLLLQAGLLASLELDDQNKLLWFLQR